MASTNYMMETPKTESRKSSIREIRLVLVNGIWRWIHSLLQRISPEVSVFANYVTYVSLYGEHDVIPQWLFILTRFFNAVIVIQIKCNWFLSVSGLLSIIDTSMKHYQFDYSLLTIINHILLWINYSMYEPVLLLPNV